MKTKRSTRILILSVIVGLSALFGLLQAQVVRAADARSGDNIVIERDSVVDDNLFAAGNTITIDGTVKGDVLAAGGTVTVNGTIEGNLLATAQTVIINGTVSDTVFAAGQVLVLGEGARVGRNLIGAGYSLEAKQGSDVQGDLVFAGAQAYLAGRVGNDVLGGMNGMALYGSVGRDVTVATGERGQPAPFQFSPPAVPVPSVASGLLVADSAQVGGKLTYTQANEGDISPAAGVAGGVTRNQPEAKTGATGLTLMVIQLVQRFVTLALIGLLLVWLAPAWARKMGDIMQAGPLPSLGWGALAFLAVLVALVAIPLIAVVLALLFGLLTLSGLAWMLVGLAIALDLAVLLAFLVFIIYVAQAVVGLLAGRWMLARLQPSLAEGRVLPMLLGLLVLVLVTAIPIIGGLVGLLVVLLGLGALWFWLRPPRGPEPAVAA